MADGQNRGKSAAGRYLTWTFGTQHIEKSPFVEETHYGELIPIGGGDPVPLLKKQLLIGRRESCDIVLRFSNVSAHHCQLTVNGGFWFIKDLDSLNGVKVNQQRVTEKRLRPGDRITIAKHKYQIMYAPHDLGAIGPPPPDEPVDGIFSKSLLESAGLDRRSRMRDASRRYEVTDDSVGQIDKNRKRRD